MLLQFIQRSIPDLSMMKISPSPCKRRSIASYFVANALQFLFGSARPRLFKSTSNFG